MSIWDLDMIWLGVQMIPVAGRSCRYLWTVRRAVPLPVKLMLGLAMLIKLLPVDFFADETLTAAAVLLLAKMRPGLVKACWRAAQLEVSGLWVSDLLTGRVARAPA